MHTRSSPVLVPAGLRFGAAALALAAAAPRAAAAASKFLGAAAGLAAASGTDTAEAFAWTWYQHSLADQALEIEQSRLLVHKISAGA